MSPHRQTPHCTPLSVCGGVVLSLPKRNSRSGPGRRQLPAALEQNSPLSPGKLLGGWQRVLAGVGGKRAPTESAKASPPPDRRDLAPQLASPPLQGVFPSPAAQIHFLGAPCAHEAHALPEPRSPSSPGLTAQQRQQQDAEHRQPAVAARGSPRSSHHCGLREGSGWAHGGRADCAPRRPQEAERTGARAPLQQPQPEPQASPAGAARAPYLRVLARRRHRRCQAPPRDAPSPPAAARRPAPSTPPPRGGGVELTVGGGVWRWIPDGGSLWEVWGT